MFFDRVLVNPLVDEDGRVILPDQGDGATDSGKQPGKETGATSPPMIATMMEGSRMQVEAPECLKFYGEQPF